MTEKIRLKVDIPHFPLKAGGRKCRNKVDITLIDLSGRCEKCGTFIFVSPTQLDQIKG